MVCRIGDRKTGVIGHADHVHALTVGEPGILIGHHMKFTSPRPHLLQIRLELLQQRVLRCDSDNRHFAVDQCERAVLEFARGIRFSMDVGNFLQIERTFHCDRVVDTAAHSACCRRANFSAHILTWGSTWSTLTRAEGRRRKESSSAASACGESRPCTLASVIASSTSAASWVVKAFVEATPISGPARARNRRSVARTSVDSGTLQIPRQ
jgi:hypothetical protein